MAAYIATPRTDAGDMTRADNTEAYLEEFSVEASFQPPHERDNLFKQIRGARPQVRTHAVQSSPSPQWAKSSVHLSLHDTAKTSTCHKESHQALANSTSNLQVMATPRNPLATLRNPNAKSEFTPMLKSATANRTRQVNGLLKGGIATPAAMKPGFELNATPLPEPSVFDATNSSTLSESAVDGKTPIPDMVERDEQPIGATIAR
jgi:hypothetical protein